MYPVGGEVAACNLSALSRSRMCPFARMLPLVAVRTRLRVVASRPSPFAPQSHRPCPPGGVDLVCGAHGPGATLHPIDLLAELLQGYRHPAVATNNQGAVVCMIAAALGEVDQIGEAATAAKGWPPLATFQAPDGQTFLLRCPARTLDVAPPARALPPRLARVAGLVIDGLTDKRIAQRLGLTFSTARTYVRQITAAWEYTAA